MQSQSSARLAFFILCGLGSFIQQPPPPPQVIPDSVKLTVKTNHHTVEDVLNIWAENSPQEWLASPPLFG